MKKVLIVEDEIPYLNILHDQLSKHGFSVLEASDGKTGLALAKNEHPDLLLLDIRMPIMNGLDMLNELRKDGYGKNANVIVLTNLEPDDEIIKKIIANHPSFYFVKSDIQLSGLMEKINTLLHNPRHE